MDSTEQAAGGSANVVNDLGPVDIAGIMALLPHRYPMLLVDRVVDMVPGESAVGIKNVTINEPFFQGHFPREPVMPGVLIVEAMAQTGAVLVLKTMELEDPGTLVYFLSIDNARFRKPVVPGDRMEIRVRRIQSRRNIWKFSGEAWVEDNLCADAVCTAMVTKR